MKCVKNQEDFDLVYTFSFNILHRVRLLADSSFP